MNDKMKKIAEDKNPNIDIYSTPDLNQAVVLMEMGHALFDIDKKSIKPRKTGKKIQKYRIIFLFENTDKLRKDICAYVSGNCKIDAQSLLSRLRSTRAMVESASSSTMSLSEQEKYDAKTN